jgi:hypothetical protein
LLATRGGDSNHDPKPDWSRTTPPEAEWRLIEPLKRKVQSPSIMAGTFKHRVALLLIGVLAFAHGSVALSACSMERGTAAPMVMESEKPCADCALPAPRKVSNLCVAHCNADLQLASAAAALVPSATDLPILRVSRPEFGPAPRTGLHAPPSGAPPHRILLHSFLI